MEQGPANSHQEAVILSDGPYQRGKTRQFCSQMDSKEAVKYQLHHALFIARNMLASKRRNYAPLLVTITACLIAVGVTHCASILRVNLCRGVPLTYVEGSTFIHLCMAKVRIIALRHGYVVIAAVHINIHQTFVGSSLTFQKNVFRCLSSFVASYSLFHPSLFR